jgi:hypothetical protein
VENSFGNEDSSDELGSFLFVDEVSSDLDLFAKVCGFHKGISPARKMGIGAASRSRIHEVLT